MNTFRVHRRFAIVACLLGSLLASGCVRSGQDISGGRQKRKVVQPPKKSVSGARVIDRKTFSMTLPAGWTENTEDDQYDPNSLVFFENSESGFFAVVIREKSAGASVAEEVMKQKEAWQKNMTGAKITALNKWANYEGEGFEIEGKLEGTYLTRQRVIGFENSDNICVIIESADPGDFQTFADDYDLIRQTFKLK